MKRIANLLVFFVLGTTLFAQTCVLESWSLEKRVHMSDVVVEGHVIKKEGVWLEGKRRIYTLYTLEVFKLFKGDIPKNGLVHFVGAGGQIGNEMHEAHPAFQAELGETGLLFLKEESLHFELPIQPEVLLRPTASTQSMIAYDPFERMAFDYLKTYEGLNGYLYPEIEAFTGTFQTIQKAPFDGLPGLRSLAAPIISSFSQDTISAGTGSVLTINGNNFGNSRGTTGQVEFRDANFGDNRFYTIPFDDNYVSWTNTQIQVKVPTRAGTGTIRVTNNNNEKSTSSKAIVIPYSHLNVAYQVDEKFYETDHVNDNNKGGYTWQMNHKFKNRSNAVNAMLRSLETWRCNTLMNWDVGSDTHIDSIGRDDVNVIRITKFDDNKLGVCWSFWSGCWNGSAFDWYVTELDIEFDSTRNWYYGTGSPGGNQYDFETVATHELGHGHQLAHVIDNKKIMHYSLGTGQRKVVLHQDDLNGGNAMMTKSTAANVCGPGSMQAIQVNNCNITKPRANFTLSKNIGCPGDIFFVNDQTEGVVKTYQWMFDTSASAQTLTGPGPHQITYRSSGEKEIHLICTNDFGSDTAIKSLTILPPPPDTPAMIIAADTLCVGLNTFVIDSVENASSYVWNLISGGLIIGNNNQTSVNASLGVVGGPYLINVKAKNTCGESGERAHAFRVIQKADASFTESVDGRTVVFTNNSTNATNYRWLFGDGDSSVEMSPTHVYEDAWTFDVKLYAYNQCSFDSFTRQIQTFNPASISIQAQGKPSVYPNPFNGTLHIQGIPAGSKLSIFDLQGKVLLNQALGAEHEEVHLGHLSDGIYILRIDSEKQSHQQQIVLIRK